MENHKITLVKPGGDTAVFEFNGDEALAWGTVFTAMMRFATFMPDTIDLVVSPSYYDDLVDRINEY